jgi:hypothetical protein
MRREELAFAIDLAPERGESGTTGSDLLQPTVSGFLIGDRGAYMGALLRLFSPSLASQPVLLSFYPAVRIK